MGLINLESIPNHINGNHIHIFKWLDGCGWSINCGEIHIESRDLDDALKDLLKITSNLERVHENRGYGLVGKIEAFCKKVEKPYTYFY